MPQIDSWTNRLTGRLQTAGVLGQGPASATDLLLVLGLAACFPLYFVARGWLNAALVLLSFFCLVQLLRQPGHTRALLQDRRVQWLLVALAAPLLAVLMAQLAHQEMVPRAFDSPLRLLMSASVLLYLLQRRINFVPLAEWVLPVAVLLCAAAIFLPPDAHTHFWGTGRFATYFVDPLTLGQHITILGFMCLFLVHASGTDSLRLKWFKYAAFIAAMLVAIGTQSRSAWAIVPVLLTLWLVGVKRYNRPLQIGLAVAAVAGLCLLLYFTTSTIRLRADEAIFEYGQYFSGAQRDSSPGIRLSMWRANWLLFLENPAFGWGYAHPAELNANPRIAAFSTPLFEFWYTRHGGHNEILTSMMHTGLPGLLSRLLLFIVPLLLFVQAARSRLPQRRMAGYLGLALVLGYMMASINTEVFNLIYIASFYGLLLAALAATVLSKDAE
ncbi:MAG: O-antigen ligase family protein [Pseudomonadota bacterium]